MAGESITQPCDYCNCLLYGVSDGLLKKLQAVQSSHPYCATFVGFLSGSGYCSNLPWSSAVAAPAMGLRGSSPPPQIFV